MAPSAARRSSTTPITIGSYCSSISHGCGGRGPPWSGMRGCLGPRCAAPLTVAGAHHLARALASGRLAFGSGGRPLEGAAPDAAQADGGQFVHRLAPATPAKAATVLTHPA